MEEYDVHLAGLAARLSTHDKAQIVEHIRNNTPVHAIKFCRDTTGLGLMQAKDLVDGFEKYIQ